MNVLVLDPWNTSQIFLLEIGKNIILGPIIDKKSKLRHPIEFMYEDKGNNIYYLYTVNNDSSDFKHLYLKINSNETIIENISKSKIYSGSEYVILGLQIIYRLFRYIENYNCKLVDMSFFICDRKMNLFRSKSNDRSNVPSNFKEEIQYKIISLLRFGSTFYMPFGFDAYNKTNMMNKNNEIRDLVSKLWDIKWEDIDSYMITMFNIVLLNKYKNNYMIRNYTRWYNYWINIYESWNIFKEKFSTISPTPFRSFSFFNYDECSEFINWLELYSFKYLNYNQFIFNNINNSIREMAGILLFKKLKNEVNNVVWINNNIQAQPMISNFKK
jgi:hypothetical protein